MELKAKEIANLVQGTLAADPEQVITGVAGIDEAGPGDISFVGNPKYVDRISQTKAGLLLLPENIQNISRPAIKVKNPQLAFAKVLWIKENERLNAFVPGIHPTAVISPTAHIGEQVSIGPFVVIEDDVIVGDRSKVLAQCFIGKGTKIGNQCLIYPRVTMRENTSVGKNAIIHSGTVIGSDGYGFVPTPEGHFKIPQIGNVEIGDNVEIGANVAIDRATTGKTKIGSGTKIDNLVHIAHNVEIGEHCLLTGQVGMAGSAKVGKFVTFGAQSGAAGHITIGDGVIIAARGGVTKDTPPKEVVSGFPARPHREELKIQALIQKLPELFQYIQRIRKSSEGR